MKLSKFITLLQPIAEQYPDLDVFVYRRLIPELPPSVPNNSSESLFPATLLLRAADPDSKPDYLLVR